MFISLPKKGLIILIWGLFFFLFNDSVYAGYHIERNPKNGCENVSISYIKDNRNIESWVRAKFTSLSGKLFLSLRKADDIIYFRCNATIKLFSDNQLVHTFSLEQPDLPPDSIKCIIKYPDYEVTNGLPEDGGSKTFRIEYQIGTEVGCDNESCPGEKLDIGEFIISKISDCPENDQFEPNDLRNASKEAFSKLDKSYFLEHIYPTISSRNDIDFFVLRLSNPGRVEIDLRDLENNYDIKLYNNIYGSAVDSSTHSGTTSERVTYNHSNSNDIDLYIEVYGVNNVFDSCKPYQLSVTWDPAIVVESDKPIVKITSHTSGQFVSTSKITLEGTASDRDGIRYVQVKACESCRYYSANGYENWSRSISLDRGSNTISVYAKDKLGNDSEPIQIIIKRTSPPDYVIASDGEDLDKVSLTWRMAKGMTHSKVYRSTNSETSTSIPVSQWTSLTSFNDTTATPGITYYYFIKAATDANGANETDFHNSYGESGWRKLCSPVIKLSANNEDNSIDINWDSVDGAKYYRVYRGETIDWGNGVIDISGWISDLSYSDSDLDENGKYYYWVISSTDSYGNFSSDLIGSEAINFEKQFDWYRDNDDDGYSDGVTTRQAIRPVGYKLETELSSISKDCNDNNKSINPATVWYKDNDNDGYSDGTKKTQCSQPDGHKLQADLTAVTGDCDDSKNNINPANVWYNDNDNDGYSDGTKKMIFLHFFFDF